MAGLGDLLKGDMSALLEGQFGKRLEAATAEIQKLEVAIREDIVSRNANTAALQVNARVLQAFHEELGRRQ